MTIEYIGEHLWPGKFGNLFVVLSFVAAAFSTFSYYQASKDNDKSWLRMATLSFRLHSAAILGIILTLFYILVNHYFEYHYVWQHSNTEMPMQYILSCFWEGQEGSFLLWTFWNMVLGNILIRTAKDWRAPTMTIISSVQIFLASMLLGVFVFGYKLGSNPFILLREHPDMVNMPFTQIADYVSKIEGRGLNPILQNYWMTIHPPTLFLGFASTLIPFAYAISGFWKKRNNEWQRPALPWAFFGVMILGTGVLMGGAWAYEALSFGGFWAWDPVENASLVPWITFVGSAHLMLINKNKGTSIKTGFILTTITFILILYSTFLTRSGILGDTSVHAFTDLGMSGQLLIYLIFYISLTGVVLFTNWRSIPSKAEEESAYSREFWMFIGALVLFISGFQIIFSTSIPVMNKIFGSELAPPADVIAHYNSWQIPFAIIVAILIGIGQYFKYKETDIKYFIRKILFSLIGAAIISAFVGWHLDMMNYYYFLLLFASIFAITANAYYFVRIVKGKISKGGSSIAHIGFGLILLGALISTSTSEVISQNTSGIDVEKLNDEFSNNENIMLVKGDTLEMGDYHITYSNKRKEGVNVLFSIDYLTKSDEGTYTTAFTLTPLVQLNKSMGNVAEPDTRHFLTKDIYTHITYADLETIEEIDDGREYKEPTKASMAIGDTTFSSNSIVILEGINTNLDKSTYNLSEEDIVVGARLKVLSIDNQIKYAEPIYIIEKNIVRTIVDSIPEMGLRFAFNKIDPESGKIDILISEKKSNKKDFIIMKAIVFPYINILWMGAVLLILGTLIAVKQRIA